MVPLLKASSGTFLENEPDLGKDFQNVRIKTFGTGDTSNTTFVMSLQVFDAETGANITTAYQSYLGVSDMLFGFNQRTDGSSIVGGRTVGTILI